MTTSNTTNSPTRNRLLYGAAIVVISLYAFDVGYRQMYEEPVREDENRITALREKLQEEKLAVAKAKKAASILPELQQRALPFKLEQARSSYQAWLLSLGKQANLIGLNVDSGEPAANRASGRTLYQTIPFTFRGRGNMRQLSQLLHDFYAAGHLHKIRTMSLNPVGSSDMVDINLSISTLAMPTADREVALTDMPSNRLASPKLADYRIVAQRNLFQVGGQGIARHVKLTAITSNARGVLEAWFKDLRNDRTYRLKTGESLSIGSLVATVARIEKKQAIVSIDDQKWPVVRGQNLAEAQAVSTQTAAHK